MIVIGYPPLCHNYTRRRVCTPTQGLSQHSLACPWRVCWGHSRPLALRSTLAIEIYDQLWLSRELPAGMIACWTTLAAA